MQNQTVQKSKPPYLLGLLCLMPLVGAFVGLGLLLYGILKYKDKWLSIIGAAGILWTIIVYSSLAYFGFHSDWAKQGNIEFSQKELNSLVKSIEFYNLEHGQYPDSLQQITQEDSLVFINDIIQDNTKSKNKNYNYQKLGNKYLLFSSGADGIANTNDDLFPKITITDSSKIGLINKSDN